MRKPRPTTLNEWRPGIVGVVIDVAGSSRLAARLRELGVIPGQRISVLRNGSPLIVQVAGSRLGMRPQDAAAVHVGPLSESSSDPPV